MGKLLMKIEGSSIAFKPTNFLREVIHFFSFSSLTKCFFGCKICSLIEFRYLEVIASPTEEAAGKVLRSRIQ